MAGEMHSFCTYFDSKYLDRGLCLWQSLHRVHKNSEMFICCLDTSSYEILIEMQIKGVTAIKLEAIEAKYPQLEIARSNRSQVEYYFTLTPSLIRYVFDSNFDVDNVTYVDSDLMFFSDPQPLFTEIVDKSGEIAIIGHRFTKDKQELQIYGTYNVGWVTFLRKPNALACLLEWQQQCIEWCYDCVDGERFADQKYLDAWPAKYNNVVVLEHLGANVALWNLEPKTITRQGGRITIYGKDLIFYHFHGLSQIGKTSFFTSARMYGTRLDRTLRYCIYGSYIRELRKIQRKLAGFAVHPLIRYKYSSDDVQYAKEHPFSGLFLYCFFGVIVP